jgi:alkaline phosphatase D
MPSRISRREFIVATGLLATIGSRDLWSAAEADESPFQHGVASGDPLQDRVILWTRVTPGFPADELEVTWRIARDPQLTRVVAQGRSSASLQRDYTVKLDVDGLAPGTTYFYRFEAGGARSPVGRTRTLPAGRMDHARLAFLSCANLPAGLFNVYAQVARRHDFDAVLHLGDYLYEFGNGLYGDGRELGRVPLPDREIVSLADYRRRHAQYKRDADLQAVHRQHPFICIWDDHEVANDAWMDGASNHDPDEGDWWLRKRAAIRAYLEWMPIRERPAPAEARIYREFRFGDLADLVMLDTRLIGRDRQPGAHRLQGGDYDARDPQIVDPARTLLGLQQEIWLDGRLALSQQRGAAWRLIGQQVMMAQLSADGGRSVMNLDQWDGYAGARDRLFATLRDTRIDNVVVMTGDAHASFAAELHQAPWRSDGETDALGVEFITPAVSSPGVEDDAQAARLGARLRAGSPHLKFIELQQRGYGILDVTPERVQGEIWHVDTVTSPSRLEVLAAAFVSAAGESRLQRVLDASRSKAAADPAP